MNDMEPSEDISDRIAKAIPLIGGYCWKCEKHVEATIYRDCDDGMREHLCPDCGEVFSRWQPPPLG